MLRFLSSFLAWLFPRPRHDVEELPPAKVAIIGAGMGGCFTAKFLREEGGGKLDIHVWAKKGSKVGGRTAVFEFDGHVYETGGSVIHTSNKYLSDAAKEHDLDTKGKDDPNVPIGIFNGATFLFRTIGSLKIFDIIKGLWRYGLSSIKMSFFINSLTKKFSNIYDLQASGKTYASVSDMLTAMGGKEMSDLTNVSADNYISSNLHWNKRLVDEFITGAMRVNYGQDISVNAFTTFVALAGMEDGSLWSVVGGNFKIAEKVLEASGAKLVMEDVIRVTKTEGENGIKYTIVTEDGNETGDFDAVIVANPLNLSSIKYENFSSDVYTAAAMTPYHRTVATFIKGSINQEFFGEPANAKNFPLVVVTTNMEGPPFEFNSVGFEIPSEISQKEVKEYTKPLKDDPVRVWKVFSPQPLTDAQCQSMFSLIEDKAVVDWLAYPQYHPPEAIPSFVLDDGVFYVNAIEKAASAMEMSAIGGKNAALLAREYLLQQK